MWLARRRLRTSKGEHAEMDCDDGGVRALFIFAGGSGHFAPTVPYAQILRDRGHEVMYACQEGMVPAVVSAGWPVVVSGGNRLLDPRDRRPLVAVDRVQKSRRFADPSPRGLLANAHVGSWRSQRSGGPT